MGAANSAGSPEQPGGSDDVQLLLAFGQFVLACGNHFQKIIKREIEATMRTKEFEVLLIQNFHTAIVPIVEDLFRKIAKEEIQSAIINNLSSGGNWTSTNALTVTNERRLCLRFLDEVSEDVLTGKEIKGKGGTPIRVALVDEVTKDIIKSGPESSVKVEILLLEASEHGNEHNWSHQDFNSRIIKECEKTKPHFPKSYYVYLEEGIGELNNAKLAHDSNWMKNCRCQLGARVVENLSGVKVHEAQSESFEVSDSRSKLYAKHDFPSLSDPVWRLVYIGRNGEPCKRLNRINVWTVRDFLFFHSVDHQKLQKTVGAGANAWKAIVDHARSCIITDKRICIYKDSAECNMSVVFDFVGELKGIIHDSQYVLINCLSKARKDLAHKLLGSAFENQDGITYFSDERALMHQFPYQGSFTATSTSILENFRGCNLTIPEDTNCCDPMEKSTSSQRIIPSTGPSNANDLPMHQVPGRTIYAGTNAHEVLLGCNPLIPENTKHYDPTECGASSHSISPSLGPSGNSNNTLMPVVPCRTSFPAMNTSIKQGFSICDPTIAESAELATSSQGISPSIGPSGNVNIFGSDSHTFSMEFGIQYALVDRPLDAAKDCTCKALCSAFENQTGITFQRNDSALMRQLLHQANYAAINDSILESTPGCNPTTSENINHYDPTESGISSQSIGPSIRPSVNESNASVHQVPFQIHYATTNPPIQEGTHGNYLAIPDKTNHCDQTEPGTLSQIICPTGPYGNANNTLLNQVRYGTCYPAAKTSIQEDFLGSDPTIPVSINHCESTEPGTPSQGMSPSIGTLRQTEMCVSKRRRI